jgi:preprotein translocase subunit SecA
LKTHGTHQPGEVAGMLHHFVRAQNVVERKHYDDRCRLMRIEKEKRKLQLQLGQNPYLDAAE